MASKREFVDFVLDQIGPEGSARPMMGEYLLYFRDKLIGDICDDRFLVKDVPAARALLPQAHAEPPYPGAKPMLLVEELDDRALLARLAAALYEALPAPKPKKAKRGV